MKAIALSLLLITFSFFQIRKMYQQHQKKDIIIYSSLIILAGYLSIGTLLDIYIPNPTNGLTAIFAPIQEWIFNLLS